MTPLAATTWNPETYSRFRGLRLRPALDLLAQVADLPDGDVVDLGCGNGAVGPALRHRFPDRKLIGVDTSPDMLSQAESTGCYDRLVMEDAREWSPKAAPALIFSNAALHWLPDHEKLLPRLATLLVEGGSLAVQMPAQFDAPSHRDLRRIAAEMFPDRFGSGNAQTPVWSAGGYHEALSQLGQVDAWETEYVQRLAPGDGHPVRLFTQGAAMLPFLQKMTDEEQTIFIAQYDRAMERAYPCAADGSVLFPFRRCFFVLRVSHGRA